MEQKVIEICLLREYMFFTSVRNVSMNSVTKVLKEGDAIAISLVDYWL
jgi:hypothetical protein